MRTAALVVRLPMDDAASKHNMSRLAGGGGMQLQVGGESCGLRLMLLLSSYTSNSALHTDAGCPRGHQERPWGFEKVAVVRDILFAEQRAAVSGHGAWAAILGAVACGR